MSSAAADPGHRTQPLRLINPGRGRRAPAAGRAAAGAPVDHTRTIQVRIPAPEVCKKILSLSEFLYEAEIEADPYSLYE
eukprot:SAG25_NODE_628_length_6348_cov_6.900464_1_plen_79_part_00